MPKEGRYKDLPLPEGWRETLEELEPLELPLAKPVLPISSASIGAALSALNAQLLDVLVRRYHHRETLSEVGTATGTSREAVRQLEQKALRIVRTKGDFMRPMRDLVRDCDEKGVAFYSLPDLTFAPLSELDAADLWQFAFTLYAEINKTRCKCRPLPTGGWALYDSERFRTTSYDATRFLSLDEAASLLGVSAYDLAHGWALFDGLYLTNSMLIGSAKWRKVNCIEAVAWALAERGVTEWHFSEMAKALDLVFPDKFQNTQGRNVVAFLSRPDSSAFQHVGRKGCWQLAELGDGFDSTAEAVTAILESSDIPLHLDAILGKLERNVRSETVQAILSRESTFHLFGNNVYGLAERDYQTELPEAAWLRSKLGDSDVITQADAEKLAAHEGIDPARLRSAVELSKALAYSRGGGSADGSVHPATYETAEYYDAKQFGRWFNGRNTLELPSADVLEAGLERAVAEGNTKQVLETVRILATKSGERSHAREV